MNESDKLRQQLLMAHVSNQMLMLQIQSMVAHVETLQCQVSEANLLKLFESLGGAEAKRLDALRDDAIKALRLLVDKGFVTQDELNEAIK